MLEMPRRSVTRFFIPLIDVLILLFGIFLLLPFVEKKEDGTSIAVLQEQIDYLQRQLDHRKGLDEQERARRQQQLEDLRKEKAKALQDRLVFRVLEIDGQTGQLHYYDPTRQTVKDQEDALKLIDYDRRERAGGGQREMYYLILYPRERDSDHPTWKERQDYERWFKGVALGFDVPRTARQERKP